MTALCLPSLRNYPLSANAPKLRKMAEATPAANRRKSFKPVSLMPQKRIEGKYR
jgi:hypothetical protein